MAVYQEGKDEDVDDDKDRLLPEVNEGDVINLDELRPEQHFTEPPPRFTEASLVKTLEEYGIGRPSTYVYLVHHVRDHVFRSLVLELFQACDLSNGSEWSVACDRWYLAAGWHRDV